LVGRPARGLTSGKRIFQERCIVLRVTFGQKGQSFSFRETCLQRGTRPRKRRDREPQNVFRLFAAATNTEQEDKKVECLETAARGIGATLSPDELSWALAVLPKFSYKADLDLASRDKPPAIVGFMRKLLRDANKDKNKASGLVKATLIQEALGKVITTWSKQASYDEFTLIISNLVKDPAFQ
jgi:hypothetical protein